MITKVYYSVQNCGDGSAYPVFFESQKSSEFHQYLLNEYGEGWGENCDGVLEIESDGPISIKKITTDKEYIQDLKEDVKYISGNHKKEIEDFILEYEASLRNDIINNIINDKV